MAIGKKIKSGLRKIAAYDKKTRTRVAEIESGMKVRISPPALGTKRAVGSALKRGYDLTEGAKTDAFLKRTYSGHEAAGFAKAAASNAKKLIKKAKRRMR